MSGTMKPIPMTHSPNTSSLLKPLGVLGPEVNSPLATKFMRSSGKDSMISTCSWSPVAASQYSFYKMEMIFEMKFEKREREECW